MQEDEDVLGKWLKSADRGRRRRPRRRVAVDCGVRFAFYGRTSTVDYQDRWSSSLWQRDVAELVVGGRGVIVAEFFDVGCSRRLPWARRPRAAALLSLLADPDRGFDAVVVGEFERAFFGDQFTRMVGLFARHGVQLWLPETHGPVDLENPRHLALMDLLGSRSREEVVRCRRRVLVAMRAQAGQQGRFLGGRPPYGYRLVDGGPHPNKAHAQWGRRLRKLDPDPATAGHVRWMFAQRVAGCSMASIARGLNDRGVPCPSGIDPERNQHRSGQAWTLRTVAAILGNPRYTGRQVWNRQCSHVDGRRRYHWNPEGEWVVSAKIAHTALVSQDDFVAAQAVRAARENQDGTVRAYVLAGLVRCGLCGRRMDSHWVNGRAGYRCRHGHTSANPRGPDEPRYFYVREDHLVDGLTMLLPAQDAHLALVGVGHGGVRRPCELATWLRANGQRIGYDGSRWFLEPSDQAV